MWIRQNDFSSGIISRKLWERKELPFHRAGVSEAVNVDVTIDGGIERRRSSYFSKDLEDGEEVRMITWKVGNNGSALVVITRDALYVYPQGSIATTKQHVRNPSMINGWTDWKTTNGRINSEGRGILRVDSTTSTAASSAEQEMDITASIDSFLFETRGTVKTLRVGVSAVVVVYHTSATEENQLFQETYIRESSGEIEVNISQTINAPTPAWSGKLIVGLYCLSRGQSAGSEYASFAPDFVGITTAVTAASDVKITFDPRLPEYIVEEVQYAQNPYEDQMVFFHQQMQPSELVFDGTNWDLKSIQFVGSPNWGTDNKYPGAVGSYQGRLLLGNSPSKQNTLWGSKPGAWRDFTTGTSADDSFEIVLAFPAPIMWIYGHKSLVLGTEDAEFEIAAESGIIQPGDLHVNQQSSYGSKRAMAVGAGHMVAYITASGRAVRTMDLQRNNLGWISGNMTMMVEHLTKAGVVRLATSQSPAPKVYAITKAGNVLVCTFDPGADRLAWTQYEFRKAKVHDICVMDVDGQDVIYLGVTRTNSSGVKRVMVDVMETPDPGDFYYGTGVYMDASVRQVTATNTTTVTGLTHIEDGYAMQVVVDGQYVGDAYTSGGQLTSPVAGKDITVGARMDAYVMTLPVRTQQQGREGMGSVKTIGRAGARVIDSKAVLIGTTERAGPTMYDDERLTRTDVPIPESSDPATSNGMQEAQLIGASIDARILIGQDWPVQFNLTAWYAAIESGDF